MKRILLISFLITLNFGVSFADSGHAVIVELQNGEKISFLLSYKPSLTFDSSYLTISCTNFTTETQYTFAEIKKIFTDFVENEKKEDPATNIPKEIETSKLFVSFLNNQFVLRGVKDSRTLKVCTISGQTITPQSSIKDDIITINTSTLSKGVYVVSADGQSYKIMLK